MRVVLHLMPVIVVAAGFALMVIMDDPVPGGALVVATVLAGAARLIWQAITEGPSDVEPVMDEEERCCICDKVLDVEKPHASLTLQVEQREDSAIEVLDAGIIAGCCRPECLRQLWERLTTALPGMSTYYVEPSIEALTRHAR